MVREMRRKDKALSQEELNEIMAREEYGVLSTVDADGMPYGVPVNFVYDAREGKIWFHSATEGHKVDNLAFNAKASFCVVTDVALIPDDFNTKFRSVIAFGQVAEVTEEEERLRVFRKLLHKFSADFKEAGEKYIAASGKAAKVYALTVEHITAKGKK